MYNTVAEMHCRLEEVLGYRLSGALEGRYRSLLTHENIEVAELAEDLIDSLGLDVYVYYHNAGDYAT